MKDAYESLYSYIPACPLMNTLKNTLMTKKETVVEERLVRSEIKDAPPNDLPIFDQNEFLELIGDEDIMIGLLNDAPRHLSGLMESLETAIREKNAEDINRRAHTLKGMCANITAKRLLRTAAEIEQAGSKGIGDIDPELTKRLKNEYEAVLTAIKLTLNETLHSGATSR